MSQQLVRSTSLAGAIVLGLGSILGTGAFVSVGIGADIAGGAVLWAILIAAVTALCNGL
ncbi:MAG: amino acid transporter, partial [Idiomarina sp.]|nr:amino acid transporter [Idiomarina sp.]